LAAETERANKMSDEWIGSRREVERLRAEQRAYEHEVMTGRSEQHERLVAEVERLRADAERYRWLRDEAGAYQWESFGWLAGPGDGTDAAIDAAMRQEND
jgi:hypothetical protein